MSLQKKDITDKIQKHELVNDANIWVEQELERIAEEYIRRTGITIVEKEKQKIETKRYKIESEFNETTSDEEEIDSDDNEDLEDDQIDDKSQFGDSRIGTLVFVKLLNC